MLREERAGRLERTVVTSAHRDVTSGVEFLVESGRAGKLALPEGLAGTDLGAEVLRGSERIGPGWRFLLGRTRVEALGTEPYRRRDGMIFSRPLMILASREGQSVLFADFANDRAVHAVAREFESRRLQADVIVTGFAWRHSRQTSRLVRLSGARLALVKFNAFEDGEAAGRRLLRSIREGGARTLVTHRLGSMRAELDGARLRVWRYDGERWQPLAALRRARPVSSRAGRRTSAATRAASSPLTCGTGD
jgi:hypothetical protein